MGEIQPSKNPHDEQVDTREQPFLDHVIELRSRILRTMLAILLLFFPIYYFANDLYAFVAAPLLAHLPVDSTMIATEVASPFLTPFKLAIFAAVFLAMPYLLHQIWAFVSPGLYLHEKRFAMPLFLTSVILFYVGVAFAYYIVFPLMFSFLTATAPEGTLMSGIGETRSTSVIRQTGPGFTVTTTSTAPVSSLRCALVTRPRASAKPRSRRFSSS